jgi:hypothetical protein
MRDRPSLDIAAEVNNSFAQYLAGGNVLIIGLLLTTSEC